MTYSGSAPVRQPAPALPEHNLPGAPGPMEMRQGNADPVANLRLLWERRRFLFRVLLFAKPASALIAFLIPERYESTARLMPPDPTQSGGIAMAAAALSGGSGLGALAGDMLGLKSTSDIFVGILSSRTVQDKLIQQFDMKRLYGDRRMEDARKDLAGHTGISVDRKSQIITVTVTDHDPRRAAAISEAYIVELNQLVSELSTSSARRERIFLQERLKAVSQDLETAEKEFSQFSSKNTAIDIKEQGRALVDAAATLQGQYIAAQAELEGLKQIYTNNNVRVRAARARIAELKRQLEKLGGKGEQISEPDGQGDSLYPSIRRLPLIGVAYADLYRRTRVQEAVFETLTKEYEVAKVQEAKEIPTVKVLDQPNIAEKKSFPPRRLVVFLGTAFTVALGTAWVFGKAAWDETDARDPRKALVEEVFTTVRAKVLRFSRNGSEHHAGSDEPLDAAQPHADADVRSLLK